MRRSHWAVLVGLCLTAELVCVGSGKAQSTTPSQLFPVNSYFSLASGFNGPSNPAPVTLAGSNNLSSNTLTILPQQQVGIMTPLWRNLMIFPNINVNSGSSALPAPTSYPGAAFFNNLNPFVSVGH